MNSKYYIYVLQNLINKKFYIGYTTDINRRLKEHKNAKLSHRNKNFVVVLVEVFLNKNDAQRRENYLKTSKGKFTLKAMLQETMKIKR